MSKRGVFFLLRYFQAGPKTNRGLGWALFFVVFSLNLTVYAQTSSSTTTVMPSVEFDTSTFPQWAKDLRRAEIVAFGSFPFTLLLATFTTDTVRFANNSWDTRYAPWPIRRSDGGVEMNAKQRFITIGAAAAGSVLISLVDHFIVRYKRNKAEEERRNLPDGSPIIIRRPWPETDTETGVEVLPENGEP
ncbi:hypothetical protein LQZ21_03135 [Treponema sp. TIM-1]|uniref:hypothetical protein n=1 Tax=Treponema sp. TIM-1 TaxID=2898417 RepID=UPI00397EF46C